MLSRLLRFTAPEPGAEGEDRDRLFPVAGKLVPQLLEARRRIEPFGGIDHHVSVLIEERRLRAA